MRIMPTIRNDVRKKLIQIALAGGENTITYGEIMKEFHIPRGNRKQGIGIGWILGQISENEDSQNRPLISAIVVRRGSENKICRKGYPGKGFFGITSDQIPDDLKTIALPGHRDNKMTKQHLEFVCDMQHRVWNCSSWDDDDTNHRLTWSPNTPL